jgi:hypothetical protein
MAEQKKKNLTKLEADLGFDFLKKHAVPAAVRNWNTQRYVKQINAIITPEDVIRHLKKIRQDSDRVIYSVKIDWTPRPPIVNNQVCTIDFTITKDAAYRLMVTWRHIWTNLYTNNVMYVSNKYYNPPPPDPEDDILPDDIDEVAYNQDDYGNHDNIINKQEESEALNFIKKEMIPAALHSYNKYKNNHYYEPITDTEIRRNLKKTFRDFPDPKKDYAGFTASSIWDPSIRYTWESKPGKWEFTILKSRNKNKLYATWSHPFNFAGNWIEIKRSIMENIESKPGQISKMEADWALQQIKRYVVPKVVRDANKFLAAGKSKIPFTTSQMLDEKDITKHLRKWKQYTDKNGVDIIEWASIHYGRMTIIFFTTKVSILSENELWIGYRSFAAGESGYSMLSPNV